MSVTMETAESLRSALRGTAYQPGSPEYEAARPLHNAMIQKRPALIVRCRDAADVQAAIGLARNDGLDLAIRGGGHNGAGLGSVDDGVVIDLSLMNGVRIDPEARLATVQGGALIGDLDHAAGGFGLAVPSGIISTTGVGGLTLGGGHGYLTRAFGLTADNLTSADVILADGSFVTAADDADADLIWALRGGGGNFGVVTSLTFQLHRVSTVLGGPTLWALDDAPDVLRWYREFLPSANNNIYGFFAFLTVPPVAPFPDELHLQKMCGVVWCCTGGSISPDELLAAASEPARPAFHAAHELPYSQLQRAFDALYPAGDQWYWKGDFVAEIPDEAIERHLEFAQLMPTMQSGMHLYPIDGAAHRVGPHDTAFSYRDATWSMVMAGIDPDPELADELRCWTTAYWEALHEHSMGGAYVNFMMDEGDERVRATYRGNYERLSTLKDRYDPDNLFHINQNVRPHS